MGRIAVGVIAALLLTLVGSQPPAGQAQERPLVVALGAEPRSLLAMHIVDWTTNVQQMNIYDRLYFWDGMPPRIRPSLAAELPQTPDDLTWVIKLRPNVRFHNGDPLTAEDVKSTIEWLLDARNQSHYRPRFSFVDAVEAVDPLTVRIKTKEPAPILRFWLVDFTVHNARYIRQVGNEQANRQPVGAGPYRFVRWDRDERLVLEANPNYWNGAPAVRRVEFRFIPDFSARLAALLAGEADIVKDVPPVAVDQVNRSGIAEVRGVASSRINYVALVNLKPGPMQDRRVRQALNYAVNVDEIIANLFKGRATRIPGALSALNQDVNPNLKPYPYDPQRAVQLLKEAGYDPSRLEFTLDSPSGRYPLDKEAAEAIAAYLGRIGIRVRVQVNEWGTHLDKIINRRTGEMFYLGWGPALEAQGTIAELFRPERTYSGFGTPALTQEINRILPVVDPEKRRRAWYRIQVMLYTEAPWIFLWQQHDLYGVNKRVNWQPHPAEKIFLHDASWSRR
ncbi:MAG: ABC transporter substrate-binding protein [Armatimonadota bacterium]|nr:ABC transporter substrate-binding protein [Armatimonadota bacterium]MDR7484778.1 ABC transporter substrate-binding protein [Armatimonadota bacterium]MDR7531893.1 ABC transporter substrate-binding protein [Armatimonadota bacterium]MDR7534762.1 ABC transporter substrate-binding protein [Armatimonadota bacterium]